MLIDWFTVVAQTLNFLVLVWLLKRFLYRPILDALDAREKRIAAELADASAKKAQAGQERDEFTRKNLELDQQRAALMSHAEDEASVERERLLGQARKESDALRTKWQEALRSEHRSLSEELARRTREEVFAIARKTLKDLATMSLEEQMTEAFILRLNELSPAEKDGLKVTFEAASSPAIVRSTFSLPAAQRHAIEGVAKDVLTIQTQLQFETAPELVSGIELTANGHKIAWSIGDYLASLKKSVDEVLKERPAPAETSLEQQANEQPI
jgi:F-type H+-transporting ATPase subunit b